MFESPAVRSYRRLVAESGPTSIPSRCELLSRWIEREACAEIAQLLKQNEFRALAKAPGVALKPDGKSPERRLVDRVGQSLANWADALERHLRSTSNLTSFARVGPYGQWRSVDEATMGELMRVAAEDYESVKHMANRPWGDLVCVNDYFELSAGLGVSPEPGTATDVRFGQFLPFSAFGNPDLIKPGNRIVQGLFLRIDHWHGILQSIDTRCRAAQRHSESTAGDALDKAKAAKAEFTTSKDELRRVLLTDRRWTFIEDAVVLVQIYADYFPRVEFEWLTVPKGCRRHQGYSYFLIERECEAIAARTADALDWLGNDMNGATDVEQWIELLRYTVPLLIIAGAGRRECYWQGERVETKWFQHEAAWLLLWDLAKAVKEKCGASLAPTIEEETPKSQKSTRNRLKQLIPDDLNSRIQPGEPHNYSLLLEPSEISMIEIEQEQRLSFY